MRGAGLAVCGQRVDRFLIVSLRRAFTEAVDRLVTGICRQVSGGHPLSTHPTTGFVFLLSLPLPDMNAVLLLEGEEETSSEGFREAVLQNLHWFRGTGLILQANSTWVGRVGEREEGWAERILGLYFGPPYEGREESEGERGVIRGRVWRA